MSYPIIQTISPFDALLEYTVLLSWNGFQPRKNRLIIRDNLTNGIVYDSTITTTLLRHVIPANSLQNGNYYNVEPYVYDVNNMASAVSPRTVFVCLATPSFAFSNLNDGDVVQNSQLDLLLDYSQDNGELLDSYTVYLYDFSRQEIYNSGLKLSSDLTTTITGLLDNSNYFIRAVGETVRHVKLDTGYLSFNVKYEVPSSFSLIALEENKREASVTATSHIILVEGYADGDFEYIDNKMVDLSSGNTKIYFDEAFRIIDNFTLHLVGKNFNPYVNFLRITDKPTGDYIELKWWEQINDSIGTVDTAFIKLIANSEFNDYIIYSDKVDAPWTDRMFHIWVRKKNGIFDIRLAEYTEVE